MVTVNTVNTVAIGPFDTVIETIGIFTDTNQ
jgi:hypothetical protein